MPDLTTHVTMRLQGDISAHVIAQKLHLPALQGSLYLGSSALSSIRYSKPKPAVCPIARGMCHRKRSPADVSARTLLIAAQQTSPLLRCTGAPTLRARCVCAGGWRSGLCIWGCGDGGGVPGLLLKGSLACAQSGPGRGLECFVQSADGLSLSRDHLYYGLDPSTRSMTGVFPARSIHPFIELSQC